MQRNCSFFVSVVCGLAFVLSSTEYSCGQELVWEGWGSVGGYGLWIEPVHDLDRDGWPDFMISEMGAAYSRGVVFLYSGRNQKLIREFVGTNPGDNLALMAPTGDLDGDGVQDFLLGAINASFKGTQSGRVYQYSGRTLQPQHWWDGEETSNSYAWVEGIGDLDRDGWADYLVTAPMWARNSPNYNKGKVYAYSGWTHTELYTLVGENESDTMFVLCVLGDLDGDGVDDFITGAPRHDSVGLNSGRFYVFSGRSGRLIYSRDGAKVPDQLGWSAASSGDLDRDGWPDFVVGAPFTAASGTAYLYSGKTGTVIREWSSDGTVSEFGKALAAGKDVDGDGVGDILIGAPGYGPGKTDYPAAFLYSGRTGRLLYRFSGRALKERQGQSVALLDDVTGDHRAEMLIGASAATHFSHQGRVRMHAGNDLFLQATWRSKRVKLVLQTRGGPPGAPAMVAIAIEGQPTWSRVLEGTLDANGEWRLTLQVPPAFLGLQVTAQSFARDPGAAGPPWRDSAVTTVLFQ